MRTFQKETASWYHDFIRFAGLYFDQEKCVTISILKGQGFVIFPACSASLCCMWLSLPFLDSYWVRVVVHRQEIIWTLSVTVKPQAAIGYDPAPGDSYTVKW